MKLDSASISRQGVRTSVNQDALLASPVDGLFAVADGMGGGDCGETASRLAIACLQRVIGNGARPSAGLMDARLQKAFSLANRAIYRQGSRMHRQMGTTLTVAALVDGVCYVGHLGDSRAYLVTEDEVRLLTRDNRLVADMVRGGLLTESAAEVHPRRNILTGCLGLQRDCTIQVNNCPWTRKAKLVLCTDGVTDWISGEEIDRHLRSEGPSSLVESLPALARAAGSTDDLTVVAVEFV